MILRDGLVNPDRDFPLRTFWKGDILGDEWYRNPNHRRRSQQAPSVTFEDCPCLNKSVLLVDILSLYEIHIRSKMNPMSFTQSERPVELTSVTFAPLTR